MHETTLNILFSNKEIGIGDFANPVWQQAETAFLTKYWSGAPAPEMRHAEARLVWTNEHLTVRFDCRQGEPYVVNLNPRLDAEAEKLYDRDVCELFAAPDLKEPERYFEFEAAPTGEWLDLAVRQLPDKRETDWSYDSGMKTAGLMKENFYTVIFQINLQAFGKKPKPDEIWRGNLFRCVGSGETRGYLAWQPTKTEKPNFHVPEKFGWLKFKG